MPGRDCRFTDLGLTNAAGLYGWEILQIGDSITYDGYYGNGARPILCSAKPAMTLCRARPNSDMVDLLHLPLPITAVELAEELARRARDEGPRLSFTGEMKNDHHHR